MQLKNAATKNKLSYQALAILTMPVELRQFVINNCQFPSPFNKVNSGSFYSKEGKSWNYTPEGTIRVSDHWNFYSRGEVHCTTDVPAEKLIGKWAVGQYNTETGIYNIIALDEKDYTALNKYHERAAASQQTEDVSELKRKRLAKAAEIKKQKAAAIRAEKIRKGKLWVEVNVNEWAGSGRHIRFAGTETLVGVIMWESKTGSSFRLKMANGAVREIRKWNSYQELKRKPYTRKPKMQLAA